jgi:hypothetical protein
MIGLKYKLAHKRQGKEDWSARDKAQNDRLIEILKEMITQLETDAASQTIDQNEAVPLLVTNKPKKAR